MVNTITRSSDSASPSERIANLSKDVQNLMNEIGKYRVTNIFGFPLNSTGQLQNKSWVAKFDADYLDGLHGSSYGTVPLAGLTAGYLTYCSTAPNILASTGIYYDSVNGRYGIGTGATVPSTLTIQNDGVVTADTSKGIALINTTNATVGVPNQMSPMLRWQGSFFLNPVPGLIAMNAQQFLTQGTGYQTVLRTTVNGLTGLELIEGGGVQITTNLYGHTVINTSGGGSVATLVVPGSIGIGTGTSAIPSKLTIQSDNLQFNLDITKGLRLYDSTVTVPPGTFTQSSPPVCWTAQNYETSANVQYDVAAWLTSPPSAYGNTNQGEWRLQMNRASAGWNTLIGARFGTSGGTAGAFAPQFCFGANVSNASIVDIYDPTGLAANSHYLATGLGIAHGMTTYAPTTAFFQVLNANTGSGAANAGVVLRGFSGASGAGTAVEIDSLCGGTDYTLYPAMIINSAKKSGTGVGALGNTDILCQFQNNFVGKLTLYGNGNLTSVGALQCTTVIPTSLTNYFLPVKLSTGFADSLLQQNAAGTMVGAGCAPAVMFDMQKDQNSSTGMRIRNDTNGTAAQSALVVCYGNYTTNIILETLSPLFTTAGLHVGSSVCLRASGATAGMRIYTEDDTDLILGVNNIARLTIAKTTGNVDLTGKLTVDHVGEHGSGHGVVFDNTVNITGIKAAAGKTNYVIVDENGLLKKGAEI